MSTRQYFRFFSILILLVRIHTGVKISYASEPFPPQLETDLSAGATAIYLLDFKSAEQHFRQAVQIQPQHPAPYFFLLMLTWYRLTYDSLLNRNRDLERLLEDQSDQTVAIAKKFSKNKESEAVSYLYWGAALGAKGWYYVSRRQWVRAYFAGKKGYQLVQKTIELNPAIYDAYLGLGMYEYYAATLGPILRVLSSFLIRGNRETAFEYLQLSQSKSRYVKLEASYFIWNAALDEERLAEALRQSEILNRLSPHSPLFKWCEIQTLFYQKEWKEVIMKGEEYIALAQAGPQPKDYINSYQLLLSKVIYHCGLAALNLRNIDLAKNYFNQTIDQVAEFPGWKVMAYLRRGELFDLENKRLDAIGKYKAVLRFPDVWDSHKIARERIKKPLRAKEFLRQEIIYSPLQQWKKDIE